MATEVVAAGAGTTVSPPGAGEVAGGLGLFPILDIPPKPTEILHLPFERAQMLATLPRASGRLNEFFWAALTGLLGASPGASEAVHAALAREPIALSLFESIEVGAALIFFTLMLTAIIQRRLNGKTSLEYLDELRNSAATTSESSARPRVGGAA